MTFTDALRGALDWKTVAGTIAAGITLAILGFAARAVQKWWRERAESEFWPAQSELLLTNMYKSQGRAVRREKKDRFTPPYLLDAAIAGNTQFGTMDLDHLVSTRLVEPRGTVETNLNGVIMIEQEYVLTRRGRKWGRRLFRREKRSLARIRP